MLFYAEDNGSIKILMRYSMVKSVEEERLSDLGGKAEFTDIKASDTAMRKVQEESNGYFEMQFLESVLNENHKIYKQESKYMCYIAKIPYFSDPNTVIGAV